MNPNLSKPIERRNQHLWYIWAVNPADLRDLIDNEFKRVKIQNHVKYGAWYAALTPYARQIIDFILEEDLTPEYIFFAQEAPEDDLDSYQFLLIIAGGNPNPAMMPALTNFTLGDILIEVQEFCDDAN